MRAMCGDEKQIPALRSPGWNCGGGADCQNGFGFVVRELLQPDGQTGSGREREDDDGLWKRERDVRCSEGKEHSVHLAAPSPPRSKRVRGSEVGGGQGNDGDADGGGGEQEWD